MYHWPQDTKRSAAASDMPAGSTMAKIKARGDLIIGGSMDAPLWSQIDPTTGQFTGFDAELGKLLAYYITGRPNTAQIVTSGTQTREALLGNGTVDVVFQTYTITTQRATQVDFAGPYFTSGLAIATRKGNPTFTSLADLGKTVIAGDNTPAIPAIQKAAPSAKIVTFSTDPECVQALEQGRGDAYVQDQGLLGTLDAAVAAVTLAMAGGMLLALGRLSSRRLLRWSAYAYVELFRTIPALLLVYVMLFGQTMRFIVLPQAIRRLLPAIISQSVGLLKDTSLGYIVSYNELLFSGQILASFTHHLIQAYIIVAVIYLVVNGSLSKVARSLEARERATLGGRQPIQLDPDVS